MIFSLLMIAVFVGVSIYFFFKTEKLYRQVIFLKRDINGMKKENKLVVDSIALIVQKNEEFTKFKFKNFPMEDHEVELIYPLINNYAAIIHESMRGKGKMHKISEKCCESYKKGSYQPLINNIANQEAHIKRMWAGNNINGFMSFIDAMLYQLENRYPRNATLDESNSE